MLTNRSTDQLRFGAVCQDWCRSAQHQQQSAPWLNLGPGAYQSLDGKVHHFSSCHGSSGSCILFYHDPDDQLDDQSNGGYDLEDQPDGVDDQSDGGDDLEDQPDGVDDQSDGGDDLEDQPDGVDDQSDAGDDLEDQPHGPDNLSHDGEDLEDQLDGPDDQSDAGDDLEDQPHGPDNQSHDGEDLEDQLHGEDDLEDQPDGKDDLEDQWVTLEEGGGRCLFLRNPFHASAVPIQIPWPCSCREPPKIVMCSSSVAILHGGICKIAPFWPADMTGPLPWLPLTGDYVDIAFYHGKIFTVTQSGELFSHDFFGRRSELVKNQSVGPYSQLVYDTVCHLVMSADKEKLLMVRWGIPRRKLMIRRSIPCQNLMVCQGIPRPKAVGVVVHERRQVMNLRVFEADLANGRWSEVNDLESQVLFISRSCCRAFRSPENLHPEFATENCVYILGVDWHLKWTTVDCRPCKCRNCNDQVNGVVPSYCVYDMTTRTASLVSLGGGHHMERARSEWFFPCE